MHAGAPLPGLVSLLYGCHPGRSAAESRDPGPRVLRLHPRQQPSGTLSTGVTNDIVRRVSEHRQALVPGFTAKYGVKRLVWSEQHDDITKAMLREKRIKRWRRQWTLALIEAENPQWRDLYEDLF